MRNMNTINPAFQTEHGEATAVVDENSDQVTIVVRDYTYYIWLDDNSLDLNSFFERYGFDESEKYDINKCIQDIIFKRGFS